MDDLQRAMESAWGTEDAAAYVNPTWADDGDTRAAFDATRVIVTSKGRTHLSHRAPPLYPER